MAGKTQLFSRQAEGLEACRVLAALDGRVPSASAPGKLGWSVGAQGSPRCFQAGSVTLSKHVKIFLTFEKVKAKHGFSKSPAVWPGRGLIPVPTRGQQRHLKRAWLSLCPLWVCGMCHLFCVAPRSCRSRSFSKQGQSGSPPSLPVQRSAGARGPIPLRLPLGAAQVRQHSRGSCRPRLGPCAPTSPPAANQRRWPLDVQSNLENECLTPSGFCPPTPRASRLRWWAPQGRPHPQTPPGRP